VSALDAAATASADAVTTSGAFGVNHASHASMSAEKVDGVCREGVLPV